nr:MAG TPA: hypothetical protein [Caudoviricetes sp.]
MKSLIRTGYSSPFFCCLIFSIIYREGLKIPQ